MKNKKKNKKAHSIWFYLLLIIIIFLLLIMNHHISLYICDILNISPSLSLTRLTSGIAVNFCLTLTALELLAFYGLKKIIFK